LASQLLVLNPKLGSKVKPNRALAKFLQDNPLAKIVIILDSHSSQDGQIVTKVAPDLTHSDILGRVHALPKTPGNQQLTKSPGTPGQSSNGDLSYHQCQVNHPA
jgi:hypothetical protein